MQAHSQNAEAAWDDDLANVANMVDFAYGC
jgi:hypothetical protein